MQTHLHHALLFITERFVSWNGIKLWDMLKIFCHKICPTPWRTGSHKTPLWLSYAIVCPHMQNNNGSRPVRHPPFTWVSYSAIISLSFLTFAWDDMLGGNRVPAILGQDSQFRSPQRCCRPLSLQSSPRSDAYHWHKIIRTSKLLRGRCAATSALKRRNEPRPRPLLWAPSAPPSIEKQLTFWWTFQRHKRLLRTQLFLHNNVQTAFTLSPYLPLSPSLPLSPPLCNFSAAGKGWMEVNAKLLPRPPTAPPFFAALHGWFTVCLCELMHSLGR